MFAPLAKRLPGRLGALASRGARAVPKRVALPVSDPAHKRIALMPGGAQAALTVTPGRPRALDRGSGADGVLYLAAG